MNDTKPTPDDTRDAAPTPPSAPAGKPASDTSKTQPRLDPVRYGDWEKNGRCIDF